MPLISEQQAAWQRIHSDFYVQSSALQQRLVAKRYEYNTLLAANPPGSSKVDALAKEMENSRQSLDELRVKRDIAMAEAGIPCGAGMGYSGCGDGGHMNTGYWQIRTLSRWVTNDRNQSLPPTVIANLRVPPVMPC